MAFWLGFHSRATFDRMCVAKPSLGIVADARPSWLRWRRDHSDETLAEIGRRRSYLGTLPQGGHV
jgi:hypothetical protein